MILPLYITLAVSALLYVMPIVSSFDKTTHSIGLKTMFSKINGLDILNVLTLFIVQILIIISSWASQELSTWFNHLQINSFQLRIMFMILFIFYITLNSFASNSYFSSKEVYDLTITKINFTYWFIMLFQANSIITTIFIVETVSSLIFLFIITSVTSTQYTYNNKQVIMGHTLFNALPTTYLQSLMFYY